jgi:hypothetical protein
MSGTDRNCIATLMLQICLRQDTPPMKLLAALIVALSVCLVAQAGSAQTVRRHLQCQALPAIGVGGLFSGPNVQQRVIITNNTSATVPANTLYTYTVFGRQFTYRSQSPLGPGQKLNVGGVLNGQGGTCDAWYPATSAPRAGGLAAPPLNKLSPY